MQAIDDPNNQRWSATNLDLLITLVQDTMFQAVLDSFDWFTSTAQTVTPAGDGSFALIPAGLTNRFYRIQRVSVVASGAPLQAQLYPETVPQASYYLLGNTLFTVPAVTGASSLAITYSYLPAGFTSLANDGTALPNEYPEGHEAALIYVSAAWAMTKGDAESMTQIARIADIALEALLTHIARRYPIAPKANVQAVKAAILRPGPTYAPPSYTYPQQT